MKRVYKIKIISFFPQVPPRHPKNRLKTLRRFALEWLADNFKNYSDEEKAAKAGLRIYNRFAPRFDESLNASGKPTWGGRLAALVEDECFFYDPNSEHGGRTRRQVSADEGGDQGIIIDFQHSVKQPFNKTGHC